jgi:DNA topoisomerase-1
MNLDKQGNILPAKAAPEPTEIICHKCKEGRLVIRQSKKGPFLGCNRFPKCRTIVSIKELDHLKQLQSAGQWPPQTIEQAEEILGVKETKKTAATKK